MDNYGDKYTIDEYGEGAFNTMLSEGLVDGVLFTASNPNDRDDSHTYWTYETEEWENMEDIEVDIGETLNQYQELAG